MQEGEKKIRAGDVFKRFGLSRGDMAELEENWGLIYYVSTRDRKRPGVTGKRQHRWYASDIMEAIERRKASAVAEAEKRRIAMGWDNGHTEAYLEGLNGQLKETRSRIRAAKLQGADYIQLIADRTEKEVLMESHGAKRKGKGKEYTEFQAQCRDAM